LGSDQATYLNNNEINWF